MKEIDMSLHTVLDRKYSHPMEKLKAIMAALRGKDGCPWDLEQDHKTLVPCLLEEAYEVVDSIESDDSKGLQEELGDLLFQSVFHARLAEEKGKFNIEDVIEGISDKLIRRHPHVFAESKTMGIDTADKVVAQWESIKDKEKKSKPNNSVLDTVPKALPAIQKADKIQSRVAKLGFDWEKWQEPIEKLWEEVSELKFELDALDNVNQNNGNVNKSSIPSHLKTRIESEMGDVLFSIVNVARHLGLDAETALRRTNDKFSKRFMYIESESKKMNKDLKEMPLSEMDELWNQAKKLESPQN
jgi:tetrapyrrole methylase family protein/MazG family protein